MSDWIRVTKQKPCPICEKDTWCGVSADGRIAHCMRVTSQKESAKGGWIHKLTDEPAPRKFAPRPPTRASVFDAASTMKIIRDATTAQDYHDLAKDLGVSPEAIDALWAGKSSVHRAWAFPMRNPNGKIIGIRLRNSRGEKWAVKGSKQGLFYDTMLAPGNDRVLYVCEGPTDTAAAITLGLPAAGRAACLGQTDEVRELCRTRGFNRIIIVADNDEAKQRPDGSFWYPGREGAERLMKEIKMAAKLILPPFKDIRAWLREGASLATIRAIEQQQLWRES